MYRVTISQSRTRLLPERATRMLEIKWNRVARESMKIAFNSDKWKRCGRQ